MPNTTGSMQSTSILLAKPVLTKSLLQNEFMQDNLLDFENGFIPHKKEQDFFKKNFIQDVILYI